MESGLGPARAAARSRRPLRQRPRRSAPRPVGGSSAAERAAAIEDQSLPGPIELAGGTKFDPPTTDIATLTPRRARPIKAQADMIREALPKLPIDEQSLRTRSGTLPRPALTVGSSAESPRGLDLLARSPTR